MTKTLALLALLAGLSSGCVIREMTYIDNGPSRVYADPVDYYYYPSAQVYYCQSSHLYYYRHGTTWVQQPALPVDVQVTLRTPVTLRLYGSQPWRWHDRHVRDFPPHSVADDRAGEAPRHQFDYYPDAGVYHDKKRNVYLWKDGEQWKSGHQLPPAWGRRRMDNPVVVGSDDDKPYVPAPVRVNPHTQDREKNKDREKNWEDNRSQARSREVRREPTPVASGQERAREARDRRVQKQESRDPRENPTPTWESTPEKSHRGDSDPEKREKQRRR